MEQAEAGAPTRYRFVVTGRVQGVWYRESARQEAERIGAVTGLIQNAADGSVVGEVQGPAERVEAFLAWCRRGPERARVEDVRADRVPVVLGEDTFIVRR